MKPVLTLVLLADDQTARFLLNRGVDKGLTELSMLTAQQFDDTDIEYADQPGRQTAGRADMGRHGFEPSTSIERQERGRFLEHVIGALGREWKKQGPDRLILAAAPKMLGALREALPAEMAAVLHADLPKDLVKVPERDLPKHFADVLPM